MHVIPAKRTVDLIGEARAIRDRAIQLKEELEVTRGEVRSTVHYLRWWRFLDYDLEATHFLDKLDVNPPS